MNLAGGFTSVELKDKIRLLRLMLETTEDSAKKEEYLQKIKGYQRLVRSISRNESTPAST